jgi:hypothetical protein
MDVDGLQSCNQFRVKSVTMENRMYNVTYQSQRIPIKNKDAITNGTFFYGIIVPHGHYDINSLVTYLNTACGVGQLDAYNNVFTAAVVWSFDEATTTLKLTSTDAFELDFRPTNNYMDDETMHKTLGFEPIRYNAAVTGFILDAPHSVNLSGTRNLNIVSDHLTSFNTRVIDNEGRSGQLLFKVPIGKARFGEVYHEVLDLPFDFHARANVSKFDFRIMTDEGNVANLNNGTMTILLVFYNSDTPLQ